MFLAYFSAHPLCVACLPLREAFPCSQRGNEIACFIMGRRSTRQLLLRCYIRSKEKRAVRELMLKPRLNFPLYHDLRRFISAIYTVISRPWALRGAREIPAFGGGKTKRAIALRWGLEHEVTIFSSNQV